MVRTRLAAAGDLGRRSVGTLGRWISSSSSRANHRENGINAPNPHLCRLCPRPEQRPPHGGAGEEPVQQAVVIRDPRMASLRLISAAAAVSGLQTSPGILTPPPRHGPMGIVDPSYSISMITSCLDCSMNKRLWAYNSGSWAKFQLGFKMEMIFTL
ncbi:hypothetical protein EJB05_45315, partial [Eragrostis curvula]